MIDSALSFLVEQLNSHLRGRFSAANPLAALSSLHDPSAEAGKITLTLANIEEERTAANAAQTIKGKGEFPGPAPLNLNLFFLLSANFPDNYVEGLRVLSAAMGYFHATPLYTAQSHPTMPGGLERLSVELQTLDLQSLADLWSNFGGRYRPSAYYRLRMVVTDPDRTLDTRPSIVNVKVQDTGDG